MWVAHCYKFGAFVDNINVNWPLFSHWQKKSLQASRGCILDLSGNSGLRMSRVIVLGRYRTDEVEVTWRGGS